MGLFGENNGEGPNGESYTDVLTPDPASPLDGEVEPALVPGLAPSPTRVGLYGEHGDREQSFLVEKADEANFKALARATYDGLAQLEIAVRELDKRRLYAGPYVWTPSDSIIRVELPADRIPLNATLYRAIAFLTDASAVANEVITITDLLSVPVRLNPTRDLSTQGNLIPVLDLPFKSEGFNITKQGGGAFTSIGALYLDIREVNLV